jgi:Ribbon-helix-helix protein, copG family.
MLLKRKIKYKRINITLPERTIKILNKLAKRENKPKSRIIDTALFYYKTRSDEIIAKVQSKYTE